MTDNNSPSQDSINLMTEEQKDIFNRFFLQSSSKKKGCFSKTILPMTNAEYQAIVDKKIAALDLYGLAKERLGVSAGTTYETAPIFLKTYLYTGIGNSPIYLKDTYSNVVQSVLIFFGHNSLNIFTYSIDTISDSYSEKLKEYNYHDIISLDISHVAEQIIVTKADTDKKNKSGITMVKGMKDDLKLTIVTKGNTKPASISIPSDQFQAIIELKKTIRNKKSEK